MSGIKAGIEAASPAAGVGPAPKIHDSTSMGGMASCSTGGVYAVPVNFGTPVEITIGWKGTLKGLRSAMASETRPSFDLSKIVGVSIAETLTMVHARTVDPVCLFEYQATADRLCIGSYLGKADRLWVDTRRMVEQYQRSTEMESGGDRAWRNFNDLKIWLSATNEELTEALGIGRTTAYTWHREGREPREPTSRRLHQMHAAISALQGRLGQGGLEVWLSGGSPNRRAAIMAGGLDSLGAEIDAQLFARMSGPDFAATAPDRGGVEPIAVGSSPQPSRRKPRRAKLP